MESKEIEVRFYLIGDKGIGKESILSRFKILNCSKTNTSEEDNFSKVLQIEGFNIELKFFPIENPEEIKFNDSLNEDEDGDFINKNQKYNFAKVVKHIKKLLTREYETRVRVYHVFLFCFDLSKFSSLKILQIYYNELNVIFNFEMYYQALVGNKLDKKVLIDKDKQILIDIFLGKIMRKILTSKSKESIESNAKPKMDTEPRDTVLNTEFKVISLNGKMPYYEISTKIFFNFEKFFQKLFDDILIKIDPYFSNIYFKEKLSNILCIKPSFMKSKREEKKVNDFPGPQKYDTNVYSLPDTIEKANNVLSGNGKYKEKIYVNKGGPVFTSEKMEDYNKKIESKKKNHAKNDMDREMDIKMPKIDTLPEDYYKKLYNNFRGFTMGIKQPSVGLRRERKRKFEEASREQRSIIQSFDNINNPSRRIKSQDSIQLNQSAENNELLERIERVKKSNRNVKVVMERHALEEETRNRILQTSVSERSELKSSPNKIILPRIHQHKPIIKPEKVVGPGDYEIRGNLLNTNKGTKFGMKSMIDKRLKAEIPVANYVRLSSEFDMIDDHPTFSKAERFSKQNKLKYETVEDADVKNYERKDKIREEKIQKIRERKLDKIRSKERKILREWEDYLPGPGEYEINYEVINDKSPSYTIAGKLDKFTQNLMYDDPNKLFSLEQSVSMLSKNISKALYNLPNHNYIKESPKRVVFTKSERFQESLPKEDSPKLIKKSKFIGEPKIQKFDPEKLNSFGKAKRFKRKMLHEYPGPGEYKNDGFAENLVKKNEKLNQLKEQSIILKKTEQFDKSYHKQNSFESDFSDSKEKRNDVRRTENDQLEAKEKHQDTIKNE